MAQIEELQSWSYDYVRIGGEQGMEEAAANPTTDYFSDISPYEMRRPKALIGKYVADKGYAVPLVTDENQWQEVFDAGRAMVRSEADDDYMNYRGLFFSRLVREVDDFPENLKDSALAQMTRLACSGLRNGDISATYFMKHFGNFNWTWFDQYASRVEDMTHYGVRPHIGLPEASLWEFIPGSNVSIFGDPHVPGRYHVGFRPVEGANYGHVGGFIIDQDLQSTPFTFRKHDKPFVAKPFIEIYEEVAALELFDLEQRPVMELQLAKDGAIHFLQYFKTGHRRDYREPETIPFDARKDIKLSLARGITPPGGQDMRMFVAPKKLARGMRGEAFYFSGITPDRFQAQLAAKEAGFVLHEHQISFQDNHFDSAPLHMPPLAAAFSQMSQDTLPEVAESVYDAIHTADFESRGNYKNIPYFNIHIESNGHEVLLQSDWQPKTISYEELHYEQ